MILGSSIISPNYYPTMGSTLLKRKWRWWITVSQEIQSPKRCSGTGKALWRQWNPFWHTIYSDNLKIMNDSSTGISKNVNNRVYFYNWLLSLLKNPSELPILTLTPSLSHPFLFTFSYLLVTMPPSISFDFFFTLYLRYIRYIYSSSTANKVTLSFNCNQCRQCYCLPSVTPCPIHTFGNQKCRLDRLSFMPFSNAAYSLSFPQQPLDLAWHTGHR